MKKQYNIPKCRAIDVNMQDIIANSPSLSRNGNSDTSQESLSKSQNSLWDNDLDW